MITDPDHICLQMERIGRHNGHIIPHSWYKTITLDSTGCPDYIAMSILAEVLDWYKPTEIFDDAGNHIGWETKFNGDALQKSYSQLSSKLGWSKRQIKEAIDRLVKKKLLIREFRSVMAQGVLLSNVVYLIPIPKEIQKTTCLVSVDQSKKQK